MSEAATTPAGLSGSDSVQPSISLEDAADIDFYDPGEEDQETVEGAEEQHSDVETDEAEGQETDDIEASEGGDDVEESDGEGEAEASTPEPDDSATITVDGQTLTIGELKKGYFREADYTRQKQQVSQKERDLEALTARVTTSVNAIAEFLSKQIPDAPDASLAMTDPGRYVREKAQHEAAMVQINAILEQANAPKEVAEKLTAEQRKTLLAEENAKLVEAFPQTATEEGRKKFFETAAGVARELGYSDAEIGEVIDHRMFKLAHYAALGMQAEKARAKAAKKVENKPPVAPQKRQPGANAAKAAKNREAMKRLSRTGSIADAMAIDFD